MALAFHLLNLMQHCNALALANYAEGGTWAGRLRIRVLTHSIYGGEVHAEEAAILHFSCSLGHISHPSQ